MENEIILSNYTAQSSLTKKKKNLIEELQSNPSRSKRKMT